MSDSAVIPSFFFVFFVFFNPFLSGTSFLTLELCAIVAKRASSPLLSEH